jgi:23S rRNA pseudouridine1911/1915/1917 synthase
MRPALEPHISIMAYIILHNDSDLIAVNKSPGIASQPDTTGDESLLDRLQQDLKTPLFPIHRIDRPVSGIVIFAKKRPAAAALNEQFGAHSVQKSYLAATAATPEKPEGTLVHFLKKNAQTNKTTAYDIEKPGADRAELAYKVIGNSERYCFLHITPLTGRHHQIRAQLAAIGCPIKGDVKYGARRSNSDRSIHLHAWQLQFEHPSSGEWMALEAPLPDDSVWNVVKILLSTTA